MNLKKFITKLTTKINPELSARILKKYRNLQVWTKCHKGQTRANGKDYFTEHCIAAALHISELNMGPDLICARYYMTL